MSGAYGGPSSPLSDEAGGIGEAGTGTPLTMPALSETMEAGTVVSWLVADGAAVRAGEEVCEIETDKTTVAHPAPASGVLHIVVPAGTTCPVGTPIAQITAQEAHGQAPALTPAAPVAPVAPVGTVGAAAPPEQVGPAPWSPPANARERATPLARQAAARRGLALDEVAGTGPGGWVLASDVLAAAGEDLAPAASRPESRSGTVARDGARASRAVPPAPLTQAWEPGAAGARWTGARRTMARRMQQAASVPTFQVTTEVLVDDLLALRARLGSEEGLVVPSLNDLVVKAAAGALRSHPLVNASYDEEGPKVHPRVNVGVAVATDGALLVPTVFDADAKTLGAIATETRELAQKVRSGRISPAELDGGTFTVSNLGMYEMTQITPVVNVPQAAILGVGAARAAPVVVDGEVGVRTVLVLTLSCDHRVLTGAEGAAFLNEVRATLQSPLRLAL